MKTTKSWAALLQQELAAEPTRFTPEHKTRDEIIEEFKKAGLPCGVSYVTRLLRNLVTSGKATCMEGYVVGSTGRRVRNVKYLLK